MDVRYVEVNNIRSDDTHTLDKIGSDLTVSILSQLAESNSSAYRVAIIRKKEKPRHDDED